MHLETRPVYDRAVLTELVDPMLCTHTDIICAIAVSRDTSQHIQTKNLSTLDVDTLKHFISKLSEKINQDPMDVRFTVTQGTIVVAEPEKIGRKLKELESLDILLSVLNAPLRDNIQITLPTEIVQPTLKASDKERLGLKELIGEGSTNFKGSPKNRIYNINRSLKQFQNIIIPAGEEFSFVNYLGEVDEAHGYLPELVIKNNRTEPEFGGGICQVSSTVFRAAIYSGLKITARRNHAYPVRYYAPYGMDATIYIPKPDLTFVNNTPGSILMQATIEGTVLTFHFYGTNDGRTTTVDGPHILESHPDGSMKTVFTQEVNNSMGENFIRDKFWSNYKSPSLFPHPGEETPTYTEKPSGWSKKQWEDYKKIHP